jgi:hypothetical protein
VGGICTTGEGGVVFAATCSCCDVVGGGGGGVGNVGEEDVVEILSMSEIKWRNEFFFC